jgi:hypothetical protein
MIPTRIALAAILCSALALGGCTSARFGDPGMARAVPVGPEPLPEPGPVEAVPSGPVTAEPLPPPGGAAPEPLPGDVAALPPAAPPVARPGPTGRSALVGAWTARAAGGATCRVQLSSAPALDLYQASASGCAHADLARINAWDYRDGEVYLYQSGGTVAARLRAAEGGLSGVLAKSGAPLSLAR